MNPPGIDLPLSGTHLGSGCLDNTTDPGWCVWCGREIRPPGGEPAGEAPVSAPVSAPVGTVIPCVVTVHPVIQEVLQRKQPEWFVRMTRVRRGTGGDVS